MDQSDKYNINQKACHGGIYIQSDTILINSKICKRKLCFFRDTYMHDKNI